MIMKMIMKGIPMTTNNKMPIKKQQIGACPECDANIFFSKKLFLGLKKTCPECRSELEVISLSPIELDWAYEYEYENEDEEEYDYDL